jgi:hypothetical protein
MTQRHAYRAGQHLGAHAYPDGRSVEFRVSYLNLRTIVVNEYGPDSKAKISTETMLFDHGITPERFAAYRAMVVKDLKIPPDKRPRKRNHAPRNGPSHRTKHI